MNFAQTILLPVLTFLTCSAWSYSQIRMERSNDEPQRGKTWFIGGPAAENVNRAAVLLDGDIVTVGLATSRNLFVSPGALQDSLRGIRNVYIRVTDKEGTVKHATYFGGSDYDLPTSVAEDSATGNIIVCGWTYSTDLPVCGNPLYPAFQGGETDCFIAILSRDLDTLRYCSYFGGSGIDHIWAMKARQGRIWFTGLTDSPDFPVSSNALQRSFAGGDDDAFIAVMSIASNTLEYSSYYGGDGIDEGYSLDVDDEYRIYACGVTTSSYLQTTPNALSRTIREQEYCDSFALILSTSENVPLYATYLGGDGYDMANTIIADGTGGLLIAGSTDSQDYPTTPGAFMELKSWRMSRDGFVSHLSTEAPFLRASTRLGHYGEFGYTPIHDIKEYHGQIILCGSTSTRMMPVDNDSTYKYVTGERDGFVSIMSMNMKTLMNTILLRADSITNALGLEISNGNIICYGGSNSTSTATFQPDNGFIMEYPHGGDDGWISIIPMATIFTSVVYRNDDRIKTTLEIFPNVVQHATRSIVIKSNESIRDVRHVSISDQTGRMISLPCVQLNILDNALLLPLPLLSRGIHYITVHVNSNVLTSRLLVL